MATVRPRRHPKELESFENGDGKYYNGLLYNYQFRSLAIRDISLGAS